MTTLYDLWLSAPYADIEAAQDQLDHYAELVTEDQIFDALDDDDLACAHNALADAAWLIGKLLKMPALALSLNVTDRKALDLLSRSADVASDGRQAAIERCAKQAIADEAE